MLLEILIERKIFQAGIDRGRRFARLRIAGFGSDKRRDMVEVSVIFVVGEDEDGLAPHLWILGENIQGLGDIPGAIPGRSRMIRESLGGNQPGDGGKGSIADVYSETVQRIGFRDGHFPADAAVLIVQRG